MLTESGVLLCRGVMYIIVHKYLCEARWGQLATYHRRWLIEANITAAIRAYVPLPYAVPLVLVRLHVSK